VPSHPVARLLIAGRGGNGDGFSVLCLKCVGVVVGGREMCCVDSDQCDGTEEAWLAAASRG